MSILISGSLAYDYIMDFPDSFKNHLMADQLHILSVSFVVNKLKKNFGGTAGNIAYTAKLLGAEPTVLGTLGADGADYEAHFKKYGIADAGIVRHDDINTASAHIVTDKDDNQITAFYPGPLERSADIAVADISEKPELAIIAATHKNAMIAHAKQCSEAGIPIVLDPGQQITALDPRELSLLVGYARVIIANDYEMKLLQDKTEWTNEEQLLEHAELIILTLGERGSRIINKDGAIDIAPCPPQSVDDPTGAGDAYRAGFFTAYTKGLPLPVCGKMGSVAATYAIENYGTQNHSFTVAEFENRYEKTYGEKLNKS